MTDMITAEQAQKLLDGTTPGPWTADGNPQNRIVWSPGGNRVCFMAHSSGLNDDGDIANSNLVAAAPDLARTCLALMAQLKDAKAAQALVVERAVKEGMRIAAVVPLHQAQQSMDDAIRALADPAGVEALAALRAERDGAVAAEKQRDTELQEQHRIRKAWADRALAAEAQVGALREALKMSSEGWRNALELDLLPRQHRHSAKTMADVAEAALRAERDALKVSYDDLYAGALADAKSDAQEFESDLWKSIRSILNDLDYDWSGDAMEDGVAADEAAQFIRDALEGETHRAEKAEAERDDARARLAAAEARVGALTEMVTVAAKARLIIDTAFQEMGETINYAPSVIVDVCEMLEPHSALASAQGGAK